MDTLRPQCFVDVIPTTPSEGPTATPGVPDVPPYAIAPQWSSHCPLVILSLDPQPAAASLSFKLFHSSSTAASQGRVSSKLYNII